MSIVTRSGNIFAVVGVTFYQPAVLAVNIGDPVMLVHEPGNEFDPQAMGVKTSEGSLLGYLPHNIAERFTNPLLGGEENCAYAATVCEKTRWDGVNSILGEGLRIRIGEPIKQGVGQPSG